MISQQENELITDVSPGKPAGELLRRYWQPAALVEELEAARPLVPVTLLGEKLVLFRDERGRFGLIERHCPHRGADLAFGRLEDGGIRCAFHGWLFDVHGNCLEQPAEPADSTFHQRLKHVAYPCEARNGIVFAYLGGGEPPEFPDFDCFLAPDEYTFAFKGLIECNWLQAVEVGIDPAHASFLHRFFEDERPDAAYGKQFRAGVAETGVPLTRILRQHMRPVINAEEMNYGIRILTTRDLEGDQRHYRLTNLVFPNAIAIPMSGEMTITQWHVPVDTFSCYWYAIFTSFGAPVDKELMRNQRLELYERPGYRPRINKSNSYGFDAQEQRTRTYTGMGMDINVHDQWAVESMGPVQDRTREHLGKADVAISKFRAMLKRAIAASQRGETPPGVARAGAARELRGPITIDAVSTREDAECWQALDARRRAQAKWDAGGIGPRR
jgi:phenylpropionate dioxygenase-like ring-hydroxylating dioxygenase large terminal subunit